jgi:hypothetical protein
VRLVEKTMSKGLALEELEAHSYAELLPDRIEMHRRRRHSKRVRRGNVRCEARNVGGLVNAAATLQICNRIS